MFPASALRKKHSAEQIQNEHPKAARYADLKSHNARVSKNHKSYQQIADAFRKQEAFKQME
jgi:hypothetical protein